LQDKSVDINSDDREIIEAFLDGSQSAFNVLIQKYQKKVYWIVRKMVIDHFDADDITQEVFIKLNSSLVEFRGESKFFTYLYKIATNYSLNHLSKKKREAQRTTDIETVDIAADEKSSGDLIDDSARTKLLEEAIGNLPEQQRAVFNMRYYDDLSYEEISQITNKSVGGMKANYFHAVKNIQKFLSSCKNKELMENN
jgi:RNA polymerase sigma-70 factor (ECF subfamily)